MDEQEISDFFSTWSENLSGNVIQSVVIAILILIVGRWAAKFLTNLFLKSLKRADVDETLQRFFSQVVYYSLLAIVIVMAMTSLGIPTTSLIAVLGAFALAIGLALQDTLGNLASGVLIIFLRPYRVGELVEMAMKSVPSRM